MTDQEKKNDPAIAAGLSEAERMAKIRELLVGPAIADESARVDQTVDRLNALVERQQESIDALQHRIQELESSQRSGMKRMRVRLLGMMEALIADEEDVRSRVLRHEALTSELDDDRETKGT